MKNAIFITLVLSLTSPLFAVTVLREVNRSFVNSIKDCNRSGTCSLKSVKLKVQHIKLRLSEFNEDNYLTRVWTSYKTDSINSLEDYAVVQFIRGCRFDSKLENGVVKKSRNWGRKDNFNQLKVMHYSDWVIDSKDTDPVYYSDNENFPLERHHHYLWNMASDFFDSRKAVFYGDKKPSRPELYVVDRISSAYIAESGLSKGTAVNNSFELKTCIYKTADVPKVATPEMNLPGPIICFPWKISAIYDHAQSKFMTSKKLDPYCLQPDVLKKTL